MWQQLRDSSNKQDESEKEFCQNNEIPVTTTSLPTFTIPATSTSALASTIQTTTTSPSAFIHSATTITDSISAELDNEKESTTEAEVIFEFRTIVRRQSTETDDESFELNFRVEPNNNADIIADTEKVEKISGVRTANPIQTEQEDDIYCPSVLFSSPLASNHSSSPESANHAERDISSSNSSEDENIKNSEFLKQCEICSLAESCRPYELCVECIYCTKASGINCDQEYSLPTITEETEMNISLKELSGRLSMLDNGKIDETSVHKETEQNRFDETFTYSDVSEDNANDKELPTDDVDNTEHARFSELSQLDNQTEFFSSTIPSYRDTNFAFLEFMFESKT